MRPGLLFKLKYLLQMNKLITNQRNGREDSLKAMRNFPYPFLWKGGSVMMQARLLPSADSFSCN